MRERHPKKEVEDALREAERLESMTVWRFSLIIEGPDLDDDDLLDALFEAGCDDALFGGSNGVQCADFHREAERIEDAVLSAIGDVEQVEGVRVVGLVDQELVTLEQIMERTGRPPAELRMLANGESGADAFPAACDDPRRAERVWRWREIADWLAGVAERPHDPDEQMFIALTRAVEARCERRKPPPDRRAAIDQLITAD